MPPKNGTAFPHAQQVQVCAWRIKYRITLPAPLSSASWRALTEKWPGSSLEVFPLPMGQALYKLTLPEKSGTLTGSPALAEVYAVLRRAEAERLLAEVLLALAQVSYS